MSSTKEKSGAKAVSTTPSDKTKKWQNIPYNNRELIWLDFNIRVLEEAFEKENPIMERCNYLAIT